MVVDIGDILISKLLTLPFIDKYAGVVKTIQYKTTKDSKIKSVPASVRATITDCERGQYFDLCPDSTKKSVLFLEDRGTRLVRRQGGRNYFRASFDLICWLNMPQLGYEGASYSAIAVTGIITKFPVKPFNSGIYNGISITVQGEESKTRNPFAKYNYDETVGQYLMHPFDYFVLPIDVDFMVTQACISALAVGDPAPCQPSNVVRYVTIIDRATQEVIAQLTLGEVYEVDRLRRIIQTLTDPAPITIVQALSNENNNP